MGYHVALYASNHLTTQISYCLFWRNGDRWQAAHRNRMRVYCRQDRVKFHYGNLRLATVKIELPRLSGQELVAFGADRLSSVRLDLLRTGVSPHTPSPQLNFSGILCQKLVNFGLEYPFWIRPDVRSDEHPFRHPFAKFLFFQFGSIKSWYFSSRTGPHDDRWDGPPFPACPPNLDFPGRFHPSRDVM
jgi:hypothetical protein